jgi:hypothetical protein
MNTTRTATRRQRGWGELLERARTVFTAPGFALFFAVVTGWVLAPGRRTVTAMIAAGDPVSRRAHDAYHRFFRAARWSSSELWQVLVVHAVGRLCPKGVLTLDLDDTLYKKSGRRVEGAGIFRDAVRSTRNKVVYALGLNLVVVTLRIEPPWGGMPVGIPVGVRLHRKDGPKTTELGEAIVRELASWLPDRSFLLCCDGAYACLAGRYLPRTTIVSRMRRDAAIYGPKPGPTGRRGRPRERGARLQRPAEMAAELCDDDMKAVSVAWRGGNKDILVFSRPVLWYEVDKKNLVLLVIVRDPAGVMRDDFFFTTDLQMAPGAVASAYAGRWSIECVNREVKQCLGAEDPQCWKYEGPERAASLSLWLYAAIWVWYIPTIRCAKSWIARPWYPKKQRPSFLDALAALRRALLDERITSMSSCSKQDRKILNGLLDLLATAA